MQTLKYAAMLAHLERLDPWLQGMGVAPKNDRIHNAIAILREAEAISKGEQKAPTSGEKFIFGLTEALEIHGIFTAFENEAPAVLRGKLVRAFSGPYHPAHETSTNSDGRNVMFELSLAAQMRQRGLPIHIGEPDVLLDVGPGFFIECKRPFRESSIRASIRDAAAQLDTNLKTDKGKYGMVAVSASRLLNPGDKLFVGPSEHLGAEQLGDMLEKLARTNERHWRKLGCSSRIVAVLFHASTPAIFRDKTIIYELSYVQVFSIGPKTAELQILQDAVTRGFDQPKGQ
jgi:hypothetical protein